MIDPITAVTQMHTFYRRDLVDLVAKRWMKLGMEFGPILVEVLESVCAGDHEAFIDRMPTVAQVRDLCLDRRLRAKALPAPCHRCGQPRHDGQECVERDEPPEEARELLAALGINYGDDDASGG